MISGCLNQSTIIGVIGTLAGVSLGFILNQVIRIGKIKVLLNNISYSLTDYDDKTGNYTESKTINANTNSVNVNFNLDFYNTSSYKQMIARDIYFVFKSSKGEIKRERIYENISTISQKTFLKNINLRPNDLLNYDLIVSIAEDFEINMHSDFYIESLMSGKN